MGSTALLALSAAALLSNVVGLTTSLSFASRDLPTHLHLNHTGLERAPLNQAVIGSSGLTRINFGSCNHHIRKPWAWAVINERHPDLWVWLGDIVYADQPVAPKWRIPASSERLAAHFQGQLDVPEYREFLRDVPVIGVNDDHDMGMNDGDRTYNATVGMQSHTTKNSFTRAHIPSHRSVSNCRSYCCGIFWLNLLMHHVGSRSRSPAVSGT